MHVTLPIIFEANVIPRGARTTKLQYFVDRETFEIRECSEQEAPVADGASDRLKWTKDLDLVSDVERR